MTKPCINRSKISTAQWTTVVGVLKRIDAQLAAKIIKDGKVTDKEINWLLDRNNNQYVDYKDFKSFNNPLFAQIKGILRTHKFSAYSLWKPSASKLSRLSRLRPHGRIYVKITTIPKQFWSDRDFVLFAVKQDGEALMFAHATFKKDKEIVKAAVKENGWPFTYADPALKKDRAFVLDLAKLHSAVLTYADASLFKDRKFILAAITRNRRAFFAIPYTSKFRKDRGVVLAAVRQNGFALGYADATFKKDNVIVLAALKQNCLALEYAGARFKKNKAIVLAAVKKNYRAIKFADASLKRDVTFMRAVVNHDYRTYKHVDATIKHDIEILRSYARQHPHTLYRGKAKTWKLLQGDKVLSAYFTVQERRNSKAFVAALKKKYDIKHWVRFGSINTIIEILKNRKAAKNPRDKRPLCVLIYPRHNKMETFFVYKLADQMIDLGYRVIYHESSKKSDTLKHLKSSTANGCFRAKALVIVGHGSYMAINPGGPFEQGYHDILNRDDFLPDDKFQLAKYIDPHGDVVFNACSTGKGGASNKWNLANAVARTLPKGVRVHSTKIPNYAMRVRKVKGRIVVSWGYKSLYVAKGSRTKPLPSRAGLKCPKPFRRPRPRPAPTLVRVK